MIITILSATVLRMILIMMMMMIIIIVVVIIINVNIIIIIIIIIIMVILIGIVIGIIVFVVCYCYLLPVHYLHTKSTNHSSDVQLSNISNRPLPLPGASPCRDDLSPCSCVYIPLQSCLNGRFFSRCPSAYLPKTIH